MERRRGPRPQRVLLVDDSHEIREMWRRWLTSWNFTVDEAADGAEAVAKAQQHRPDLVLMDLWMPVMDGLQATRELKADPETAGVPVVAMSSQRTMLTAAQARQAGCEAFLQKPLDPDDLLSTIRVSFARVRPHGEGSEGEPWPRSGV